MTRFLSLITPVGVSYLGMATPFNVKSTNMQLSNSPWLNYCILIGQTILLLKTNYMQQRFLWSFLYMHVNTTSHNNPALQSERYEKGHALKRPL